MASKRMFSSKIIESADFLNLPHSTQNLYIHLSMGADDDGIVNNAKIVMRMTGCKPKDYQKLIENGYIIEPYYASIIFLADNFDENKLNELYVEEELNKNNK